MFFFYHYLLYILHVLITNGSFLRPWLDWPVLKVKLGPFIDWSTILYMVFVLLIVEGCTRAFYAQLTIRHLLYILLKVIWWQIRTFVYLIQILFDSWQSYTGITSSFFIVVYEWWHRLFKYGLMDPKLSTLFWEPTNVQDISERWCSVRVFRSCSACVNTYRKYFCF